MPDRDFKVALPLPSSTIRSFLQTWRTLTIFLLAAFHIGWQSWTHGSVSGVGALVQVMCLCGLGAGLFYVWAAGTWLASATEKDFEVFLNDLSQVLRQILPVRDWLAQMLHRELWEQISAKRAQESQLARAMQQVQDQVQERVSGRQ